MSYEDKIAEAISVLESIDLAPQSPAMVVMPPDTGEFILGNEGGFVHLAIASLKAAQGEQQNFRNESWVTVEELDWGIAGLKLYPTSHIYLPKKRTKSQRHLGSIVQFLALLAIVICLGVGAVTIFRFIVH
ncbi:hypothetical protein [Granulicella aggregans]|uniref:hypothetical protein n=1 Tax=Granulicella aggregans TaxID=474949 RepID=UPI0021DF4E0E|nr:hypothetical protein [Granulicella aggregans]